LGGVYELLLAGGAPAGALVGTAIGMLRMLERAARYVLAADLLLGGFRLISRSTLYPVPSYDGRMSHWRTWGERGSSRSERRRQTGEITPDRRLHLRRCSL
jgi:hypothetical protein